jgi:hypothetical protein
MNLSNTMGYTSVPHERITGPTKLMQHFNKIHKHFWGRKIQTGRRYFAIMRSLYVLNTGLTNVKLSPYLIKHHAMNRYGEDEV